MAEDNPIRKEDIIDIDGTTAGLKELIKLFNVILTLMDQVKEQGKTMLVPMQNLNPATKEGQVAIAGMTEEANELKKVYSDLDRLQKKLEKTLTEDFKAETQLRQAIQERTKAVKDEIKAEQAAEGSLTQLRLKLADLKKAYTDASPDKRGGFLDDLNKVDAEVRKLEKDMGVFQRNVGNYPKVMGKVSDSVNGLSSAIGGTIGMIGNATSTMLTSSGPTQIFTNIINSLANVWGKVRENIDLYLKSADKLAAGPAAFLKDTEDALTDAKRRARGEIAEGLRAEQDARAALVNRGHLLTVEEKKQLDLEIESGQRMQEHGKNLLDSLHLDVDKVKWKTKYNQLLQEEERINDEKLEKETKWEGLQAEFTKQGEIATDSASTEAQIRAASIRADEIAKQLLAEKTDLLNREINNLNALSDMTATQEVYEDKINDLLRERNTIQKEYESGQIRINRMTKAAATKSEKELPFDIATFNTKAKDEFDKLTKENQSEFEKLAADEYKTTKVNEEQVLRDSLNAITEQERAKKKMADDAEDQRKKDAEDHKRTEQEKTDMMLGLASEATAVFGNILERRKQKELSAAGDNAKKREEIERKYAQKEKGIAIAQTMISGAQAIVKTFATLGWPAGIVGAAITAGITAAQIAVIAAQKFAEGGEIDGRPHSQGGTVIEAEKGEFVVKKDSYAKYRDLVRAINDDNPMRIAEELRNRQFHTVWGGVQQTLSEVSRQDPFTKKMYELMASNVVSYQDSNGDTVLVYPNKVKQVIRHK